MKCLWYFGFTVISTSTMLSWEWEENRMGMAKGRMEKWSLEMEGKGMRLAVCRKRGMREWRWRNMGKGKWWQQGKVLETECRMEPGEIGREVICLQIQAGEVIISTLLPKSITFPRFPFPWDIMHHLNIALYKFTGAQVHHHQVDASSGAAKTRHQQNLFRLHTENVAGGGGGGA